VHVVDRQLFEFALPGNAVLYAVPCTSKSGAQDPTESIPMREPGDNRIRIGMVHGSTFDAKDWQVHFPIAADAAMIRGLDYLALGDTHGFRFVPADREVPPTIYPGAPEQTAFDEKDAGNVAVVLINRQRRATVQKERVGHWVWEEREVGQLSELRQLRDRSDLQQLVLRLRLDLRLPAPEYEEAQQLLDDLEGTSAKQGRVGVIDLDRRGLTLDASTVDAYCTELPGVLQSAVRQLKEAADTPDQRARAIAERALVHLYRLSTKAS
jgi:DNA repair exonuclease SbcCD nuclease subunit